MRGKATDGRRAGNGTPVAARLAMHSRRDPETGCLLWTGALHDKSGYARIGINGRMTYVHVAAWELVNGPVPVGNVLRHSCDTPNCFEVTHLTPGTQGQNVQDMLVRGRIDRRGERNNGARLTAELVRALRHAHAAGTSTAALASDFGISRSQVRNITSGRHWAEVA